MMCMCVSKRRSTYGRLAEDGGRQCHGQPCSSSGATQNVGRHDSYAFRPTNTTGTSPLSSPAHFLPLKARWLACTTHAAPRPRGPDVPAPLPCHDPPSAVIIPSTECAADFAPSRFPVFVIEDEQGQAYYGFPQHGEQPGAVRSCTAASVCGGGCRCEWVDGCACGWKLPPDVAMRRQMTNKNALIFKAAVTT